MTPKKSPAQSTTARSAGQAQPLEAQIGARIRQRRIELGLRQTDVARQLGISRVQFYKYEIGEARPTLDRLSALAKLFQVPILWFFEFDSGDAAGTGSSLPLSDEAIVDELAAAVREIQARLLKLQLVELARSVVELDRASRKT